MSFAELVEKSSEYTTRGQPISEAPPKYYYLRSIGINPRKDIANIKNDFPHLAKDLKVPDFVPEDRFFSSVFRIGSPGVQLWTHYDVMDNVLIQVVGRKRVVLFPPSELDKMYLCGDKSQVLDIDATKSEQFPHFKDALRMEHILEAGDILFIPALWFHNVISIDFGVAVNVFWKHLDDSMYDGKDVYGNKDLVPAARAQQSVNHALKVLHELPDEYCQFYAQKLITNIKTKIGISK